MVPRPTIWDASNADAWASFLGFVAVPMFSSGEQDPLRSSLHVLLDGSRASSALLTSQTSVGEISTDVRSWIWSCDLRHLIVVDRASALLSVVRWDTPSPIARSKIPTGTVEAERVLDKISMAPPPPGPDIVSHALGAFRRVRDLGIDDRVEAIKLFNLLLLSAERIETGLQPRQPNAVRVSDLLGHLPDAAEQVLGLAPTHLDLDVRYVLDYLTTANSQVGLVPHPSLLLRHASSQLYQEAHLFFDRDPQTSFFPGLMPVYGEPDAKRRDVRFTPAPLARTLIREALTSIQQARDATLTILDPACGSGVFLVEALRELNSDPERPVVSLQGIDISEIAESISGFCARHALQESDDVTASVRRADALGEDWGEPDLVVMNPPFISWQDMDDAQRAATSNVLGGLAGPRSDYAMAFIWKALESVRPGGAVAAVLPSALLENEAGLKWRETIQERAHVRLLARFSGYGYFKTSAVEPAFVILVRRGANARATPVKVLVASEGLEDRALRLLRRDQSDTRIKGIDFYCVPASAISASTWLPRSRDSLMIRQAVTASTPTKVQDLFELRQGARTGHNPSFILDSSEYEQLVPRSARQFFRLAAGNDTIRSGRLFPEQYVFFPYDADELAITTEKELKQKLGDYYDYRLLPNKNELLTRARVSEGSWWRLTEHRKWNRKLSPKLVSAYFGQDGSFAWDEGAKFAVVQGIAWFPKFGGSGEDSLSSNAMARLSRAYLALLNSTYFTEVLRAYCPAVGGGQLNLSNRFVEDIPLPDLTSDTQLSELVEGLSAEGRRIHTAGLESFDASAVERLAGLARRAYRQGS